MDHFDVIVIGAGPAGCSAAEACVRAGMRTALVEKERIPRHKTCGGGMPTAVGDILMGLVPEAFVEATVTHMRHTWRFGDPHLAPINPPGADRQLALWMVQRSIFDAALAQRAASAGAQLMDGAPVRSVSRCGQHVEVTLENPANRQPVHLKADFLIGADGANGITARAAGLHAHRTVAIAIEAEIPHDWLTGHPDLQPHVMHLEYGMVDRGYAWIFPKADHLNVGAGMFHPGRGSATIPVANLRAVVCSYLASLGIPCEASQIRWYAHPLPLWSGRRRLNTRDGRILLAGDAACLINPLFGDGILNAVKSGIIAARSIVTGQASRYTQAINAEFAANLDAAYKLARFFYTWPHAVYRYAISRPTATRTAVRLLYGDTPFTHMAASAIRRLRRAILGG
ncbi:MAG: geranylgeranyl reductase family protein [Chthonomonadales bacterium]